MWTGGDGPTWCCNSPPVEELDCAERERRMRLQGWRIAAIERYLDNGGQLCPQFDYVTLLRDPIDRVFSHVNHWFHNLRMASHYPVQIADPPMPREAVRTRDFFRRVSSSDCTTTSIREAILDMDYVRAHRVPLLDDSLTTTSRPSVVSSRTTRHARCSAPASPRARLARMAAAASMPRSSVARKACLSGSSLC